MIEVFDKQRSARLSRPIFIGGGTFSLNPHKLDPAGRDTAVQLVLTNTRSKATKLPEYLGEITLHVQRG